MDYIWFFGFRGFIFFPQVLIELIDLRESPMSSCVWEALLWRTALSKTELLYLGGYAPPIHPSLIPHPGQLVANEWMTSTEGQRADRLPKGETNSVGQFMLQSLPWGQAEARIQLRAQPCF